MILFKIDSILVWMQANNKFWAHSTGIFLTYFASALCGRLSHITDSIKSDIIGHVRNLPTPPTIFLQTFDNFNRQNVISQRKSKWLIFLKWLQLDSNPESLSSLTNTQPFGQTDLFAKRNHLVSLAKWLSVRLRTKWFWLRVQLQSHKFLCLFIGIRVESHFTSICPSLYFA